MHISTPPAITTPAPKIVTQTRQFAAIGKREIADLIAMVRPFHVTGSPCPTCSVNETLSDCKFAIMAGECNDSPFLFVLARAIRITSGRVEVVAVEGE